MCSRSRFESLINFVCWCSDDATRSICQPTDGSRLFNLFFLFLYSKKLAKITKAAVAWWAFFCSVPHVPMRALIRQGEATWTSTSSSSCCTTDFPFFSFLLLSSRFLICRHLQMCMCVCASKNWESRDLLVLMILRQTSETHVGGGGVGGRETFACACVCICVLPTISLSVAVIWRRRWNMRLKLLSQ